MNFVAHFLFPDIEGERIANSETLLRVVALYFMNQSASEGKSRTRISHHERDEK